MLNDTANILHRAGSFNCVHVSMFDYLSMFTYVCLKREEGEERVVPIIQDI